MLWNATVSYVDAKRDRSYIPLDVTVYAADQEAATEIIECSGADWSLHSLGLTSKASDVHKVNHLNEAHSIAAVKDMVDDAITHGIEDDFVTTIRELTEGNINANI